MALSDVFSLKRADKPKGMFDLTIELNRILTSEEILSPPTPEQTYRVSHIVKLCPREEVLKYIHQVPKINKIEARLKRIFDIGRAFHTLVQNEWLKDLLIGNWECNYCHEKYKDQVHPKVCKKCFQTNFFYHEIEPSHSSLGITAHVDGILQVENKKVVLELKTINSMQFSLVVNSNKSPKEDHVRQIQMYMFLTGLKDGIILYMDKSESMIHHFEISYDEEVVAKMLSKLLMARRGMEDRRVPEERACDKKSCSRAKRCPVRVQCF